MARRVVVGLAMLLGAPALAAADPTAPQIDPIHAQREDAQRIAQQHRRLEGVQPESEAPALPLALPAADPPVTYDQRLLAPGIALLGIGAVAGLVALIPQDDRTDGTQTELVATFAIATAAGIVLILASRNVEVAPKVSGHAVGLTISGRF